MSTQRSVIPWSYSSYGDYQTCPYRFYKVKITKEFSEPPSEHIIWGNTVHKSIEEYIRDGKPMADTTARFKGVVDRYNALPGETYVEVELACDVNMKPTGFWDADAWCRGKGDIVKVNGNKGFAGDWKTGKVKPNSLQLDLMGVMVMATFPDVDKVTGVFVWLQDPQHPTVKVYNRQDMDVIMDQFEQGVADMKWSEEHNSWPKKPSGLCRQYCPVKDCQYYGKGNPRYGR